MRKKTRSGKGPTPPPDHSQSTETPRHPNQAEQPNLDHITNPWEFLERVRAIPKQARGVYTNQFLKLCSKLPEIESDALVKEGAEVFGYRASVGYETVRKFREDQDLLPARAAAVVAEDEGWMAEMVYDLGREDQVLGYLVHKFAEPHAPPKFETSVTYRKRVYSPSWSNLINTVLYVPAGIEEYGTDQMLFDLIDQYIQKYVYIDDAKYRKIAAVYVLMSWVFDRFRAIPYLRAQGQFSSGKSRYIEVIGSICYRALFGSGASSPSSLYRAITAFNGPTLILDEADFAKSPEAHEITKILNQGYQRKGGVMKSERAGKDEDGNFDVQIYPTYSPKILATRQIFEDPALESRCFSYQMPILKEVPREIPISLDEVFDQDAQRLRNMLLLWRFRNWDRVKSDAWSRIEGVEESRVIQIVQPIIACTKDLTLQETITQVAREYSDEMRQHRQESVEGMIADVLLRRWELAGRIDRLNQQHMLDLFVEETKMKMHPRTFSGYIRSALNLKIRRVGGYNHIFTPPAAMHRLVISYGMTEKEKEEEGKAAPGPEPPRPEPSAHTEPSNQGNGQPREWSRPVEDILRGIHITSTGAAGPVCE